MIKLKNAYGVPQPEDGLRVLVDRLWPRGLSKQMADIGIWMKEIAPSTDLRKWFGHDPVRWDEFVQRYFLELDASDGAVSELLGLVRSEETVTLIHAAPDPLHNNAAALKQYLQSRL